MTLILDRYSPDYRSEVVEPLMSHIKQGKSACIVGLAGVGKSNLIHFLEQREVREHYLPPAEVDRTHFISIPCWPGNQPKEDLYSAMLMWVWFIANRLNPEVADEPPTSSLPLQMLRNMLRVVCYAYRQRVVFMLDEFESLIQYQPPIFFNDLRTIRDDHRATSNVVFLVMTHRLPQAASPQVDFTKSKFYEIIRDHIVPLGPYRPIDAEGMIDAMLSKMDGTRIDPQDRQRLIRFSGGHSGLLRALFSELIPDSHVTYPRVAHLVKTSERVRISCEHVWNHLHEQEQDALRALLRRERVDNDLMDFMGRRGLVFPGATPTIFSPLFQEYILRYQIK